jgi:lipopolysaccharide export LptBFGC system permease protein LptF
MARDALPPLLRALGSTVLLAATITAFLIANKDDENRPSERQTVEIAQPQAADLNSLLSEIHELREEVEQKDFAEEVLKNPSFEWLSFRHRTYR